MNWQSHGIALLGASLIRPFALVATAWLILRVLRIEHPASRHAVWTAVLIGMLLMPVVSVMTPHWTVGVLPWNRDVAAQALPPIRSVLPPSDGPAGAPSGLQNSAISASVPPRAFAWASGEFLILSCYVVGLLVMVTHRLVGWALLRRVVMRSRSSPSGCLRESGDVVTPIAVGVVRPLVILPTGWRTWDSRTRRAVIAHEFAHLRRHDTMVSALARVVKCVLWFHPLAWWVSRQTSELAELACDVAAVQRVGDPAGYASVLLECAKAVNRAGQRVAWPGLAMASRSKMSDRIDQIFECSDRPMRKLARPRVVLAVIGVPVICLAATVALGARAPLPLAQTLQVPLTVPSDSAARLQFEVASIKPAGPMHRPGLRNVSPRAGIPGYCVQNQTFDPGHVYIGCYSLGKLIWIWAYGIPPFRVVGPAWMGDAASDWSDGPKFDIEAKLPDGASRDQIPAMLRDLLSTRFKLTTHREYREQPVYALVVAKSGLTVQTASPSADALNAAANSRTGEPSNLNGVQFDVTRLPNPDRGGSEIWIMNSPRMGTVRKSETGSRNDIERYEASSITFDGLADLLTIAGIEPEPLVNATGEHGRYSVTLDISVAELAALRSGPHDPVDIQNALLRAARNSLKRLGLELERRTVPVEVLVIDNLDKTPSEK